MSIVVFLEMLEKIRMFCKVSQPQVGSAPSEVLSVPVGRDGAATED